MQCNNIGKIHECLVNSDNLSDLFNPLKHIKFWKQNTDFPVLQDDLRAISTYQVFPIPKNEIKNNTPNSTNASQK